MTNPRTKEALPEDGARCHRCGHYETRYTHAVETYAHCPSCGRHTRWERVPCSNEAVIPHDWVSLFVTENAYGSKDTISQCARCNLVRHDYEYDGGKRSPNYPTFHFRGSGVAERDCTRGDMTEDRAAIEAQRTDSALPESLDAMAQAWLERWVYTNGEGPNLKLPLLGLLEKVRTLPRTEPAVPPNVLDTARSLVEYIDANKVEGDLTPTHWRKVAELRGALAFPQPPDPCRERAVDSGCIHFDVPHQFTFDGLGPCGSCGADPPPSAVEELIALRIAARAVIEYEWGDPAKGCEIPEHQTLWRTLARLATPSSCLGQESE